MVVMVVGMVVSVVTNHDVTPVHPNLLASGIENLFLLLAPKIQRMGCNERNLCFTQVQCNCNRRSGRNQYCSVRSPKPTRSTC